jgi:hypothetical protein
MEIDFPKTTLPHPQIRKAEIVTRMTRARLMGKVPAERGSPAIKRKNSINPDF